MEHKPGIDVQTPENTYIYTWLETQACRGANEVASDVVHFLTHLDQVNGSKGNSGLTLRLFSDSCSSQNKNSIMVSAIAMFLQRSKAFDKVVHFFPVHGHTFMPPDRVFGRIEKQYGRREEIVSPSEYHEILGQFGTVLKWGSDWQVQSRKKL